MGVSPINPGAFLTTRVTYPVRRVIRVRTAWVDGRPFGSSLNTRLGGGILLAFCSHFSTRSQHHSTSLRSAEMPCISALNFLNRLPCRGFVKWSASISPVGQCHIEMSLFATQSLMNNYRTLMCFVRLLLDCFPFFSSNMVLRLSWARMLSSIPKPCALIKYGVHITCGMASSAPTNSHSVELLVLIFCFFDIPMIEPFPNDIVAPVCPRQSSCVAKDASTHHLMMFNLSARRISGK
jgi:hypothetical protein